jgi:acyl-CoA synthetase (AMP-forming)/AMP-acid ligase II
VSSHEQLQDDARAQGIVSLVELLAYRAERQPDDVVFRFVSGDGTEEDRLTFAELRRRALEIAAGLRAYADPGDRVVLLVPPGLEYVAAFFGCLCAGAVAMPAYTPNPRRSDPRVHRIIADSRAKVALVHSSLATRLESWLALGDAPPQVRWLDVSELRGASGIASLGAASGADLAMLQYTSGSTGEPRGVMLTHANLLHNSSVIHRVSAHRPGDNGVFWLPPFHDMGLIGGIVQPVYAGLPSTLMAPATFLQRPLVWLEAMSKYRATTSGAPNFAYDLCVERTTEEERASVDLSAWRTSFNGAEPVRADTIARFVEAFAVSGLRRSVIVPCYGLAEATLIVSGGPADREAADAAYLKAHKVIAAQSSQGAFVSVDKASHDIQETRPDAIADAVARMDSQIKAVRGQAAANAK